MRVQVDEFLDAASAIGARICRDALWAGTRCNWIGASLAPVDGVWQTVQGSLGPEVYGGTAGIALFLARLFAATGDRVHRTVAMGAINHARAGLERIPPTMRLSFYSGTIGIDYATIVAGEVLHDDALIANALEHLEGTSLASRQGHELDVVSGIASAIPALLSIHRRYPRQALLDLAIALGDDLMRAAVHSTHGTSWPNPAMSRSHNLTGFSHGTAGFAWALLELHAATGNAALLRTAMAAFQYEDHWYSAEHENWPDLRDFGTATPGAEAPRVYGMAWCHGAPGIGLARIRAAQLGPGDDTSRSQAEIAVRTTARAVASALAAPASSNFSLCHGVAGNTELLLYAAEAWRAKEHLLSAEQAGRAGLATYERTGGVWPSGVNGGGQTPGLMLGTSGVGYFYLRLSDSESVPPVVTILGDSDARAARRAVDDGISVAGT